MRCEGQKNSVYARTKPIKVSLQHFLGLGLMLEWPLDSPFTRNEIPFIHRVKKSTATKPGLGLRFTFAYGSHGHLALILSSLWLFNTMSDKLAIRKINPNGATSDERLNNPSRVSPFNFSFPPDPLAAGMHHRLYRVLLPRLHYADIRQVISGRHTSSEFTAKLFTVATRRRSQAACNAITF